MATLDPSNASSEVEIEVGAAGDSFRYWVAKEALRQGELSIGSQIGSVDAMMARATSIFGWSVTATIALTGVALLPGNFRVPALATLLCTFTAAIGCVFALWPRIWIINGYDPIKIIETPLGSELEVLESLAKGLSVGNRLNLLSARRVANLLRVAWLCFCFSPVVGLLAALLAAAI